MNTGTIVTTIKVNLSPRPEYLLATCDDLPGLNVCAANMEQACERIPAAIKLLYKLNHGLDVQVYEATDTKSFPHSAAKACERFAIAAQVSA